MQKRNTGISRIFGLQRRAAEHGLVPGGTVIVLSSTRDDGSPWVLRFRYDTQAYIEENSLKRLGREVSLTREAWNGTDDVDLCNGD